MLSINASSGLLSGTIALGAGSQPTWTPTITASDGASSANETVTWGVASAISLALPPNETNREGDVVALAIAAMDATSGATLTYSASGLPGGLSINASTGIIHGTISLGAGNQVSYTPTITVGDGMSSIAGSLTWTVNSAIVLPLPASESNNEGDVVSLAITALDGTSGATVTYSASGLPGGLSINASTGVIAGHHCPGRRQPRRLVYAHHHGRRRREQYFRQLQLGHQLGHYAALAGVRNEQRGGCGLPGHRGHGRHHGRIADV